jgi:hypothetical protein
MILMPPTKGAKNAMLHITSIQWAYAILKRTDARAIEYAFAKAAIDAWCRTLDRPATLDELRALALEMAKLGEAA